MEITAAVAADLAALTEALDEPDADFAMLLHQLAADAKVAVGTFVGLTIRMITGDQPSNLTVFEDGAASGDVKASMLVPTHGIVDGARAETTIDLILYAGAPGAFTDLAADLAWLSGLDLVDFTLNQHLIIPERDEVDGLFARSLIDQAIGMLIALGSTPEQAERELAARAVRDGLDRHIAARQILTSADGAAPDVS
ncbi:MAG TPA: hypothetical protein VGJ59_23200 [Jatrophihabitantaceae bacterium]